MALVFQYGSNCASSRLNAPQRLNNHATDLGAAQTVEECDVRFNVYSQQNGCAAADILNVPGRRVWGVLFEIPDEFVRGKREDGLKTLAQIEGPRYEERGVRVQRMGSERVERAVTFAVKPRERRDGLWTSVDYVGHIVNGLRTHRVPEDYVLHIIELAIATNATAQSKVTRETR